MNAVVRIATWAAFAASLLIPSLAQATDPPKPGRRVAIIVGANEPAPGRQPLRYSHADAQLLADTLVQVGHFAKADVRVLLEPHPAEVLAALDTASRELQATPNDSLLLFYYSGHSDGQDVFPHGEKLALTSLRDRLGRSSARVRIAIVDTCRGGSWTRAKGLTVGPPLDAIDLMNVATEGTALLSSSSGMESAHEAGSLKGSFFTHHLNAGLLGAADTSGDGNVTLQEAFVYARERTVRDSARMAATTQHPSFDMQLRGRQDVVLAQTKSSRSALQVKQKNALEIIHLGSGATVVETPPGTLDLRIALVPGRYVVRRVEGGRVYSKEIVVTADSTIVLDESQLENTSGEKMAMKDADDGVHEDDGAAPAPPAEGRKTIEVRPAPPCTPCCKECRPCEDDCDCHSEGGCKKREKMWEDTTVLGVRGALTHTSGTGSDGTAAGAMAAIAGDQFQSEKLFSEHASMSLALGGGSAGLEGGLGATIAGGVRLPVGEHHGPIARIGLGGELMGNDRFYFSRVALPHAEIGYQYLRDRVVLEAGGRGAVLLSGRYHAEDIKRYLGGGSLEWGGYLAAHTRFGRIDVSYTRVEAQDAFRGGTVHVLRGWGCGYVIDKIAICVDGMLLDGGSGSNRGMPENVISVYGGLTIGFLGF